MMHFYDILDRVVDLLYLTEHISGAGFYGFHGRGHVSVCTATGEFCDILRGFVRTGGVPATGGCAS